MDQRIVDLKSTTLSGRRLTRQQIADVHETVALFPNDRRKRTGKDDLRAPQLDHGEGRLQGWRLPWHVGDP